MPELPRWEQFSLSFLKITKQHVFNQPKRSKTILLAAHVIDCVPVQGYKDLLLAAALCVGDRFEIVSEKRKRGPSESNHAHAVSFISGRFPAVSLKILHCSDQIWHGKDSSSDTRLAKVREQTSQ
jgi:hypothetical protein